MTLGAALVVWNLFLGAGYSFSLAVPAPRYEQLFILTTFLVPIPLIILNLFFPRVGAYGLLTNIGVSIVVDLSFEVRQFVVSSRDQGGMAGNLFKLVLILIVKFILFWAPNLGWSFLSLYCLKKRKLLRSIA